MAGYQYMQRPKHDPSRASAATMRAYCEAERAYSSDLGGKTPGELSGELSVARERYNVECMVPLRTLVEVDVEIANLVRQYVECLRQQAKCEPRARPEPLRFAPRIPPSLFVRLQELVDEHVDLGADCSTDPDPAERACGCPESLKLRIALRLIAQVTGTSTEANHIARDAIA